LSKTRGEQRHRVDGDREVRQADPHPQQDGYADANADNIFVRNGGDEVSGENRADHASRERIRDFAPADFVPIAPEAVDHDRKAAEQNERGNMRGCGQSDERRADQSEGLPRHAVRCRGYEDGGEAGRIGGGRGFDQREKRRHADPGGMSAGTSGGGGALAGPFQCTMVVLSK
jgi:hypothetical protein